MLWSEDTVAKLKAGDFEHLDVPHLIEEVEALEIAQKKELEGINQPSYRFIRAFIKTFVCKFTQ